MATVEQQKGSAHLEHGDASITSTDEDDSSQNERGAHAVTHEETEERQFPLHTLLDNGSNSISFPEDAHTQKVMVQHFIHGKPQSRVEGLHLELSSECFRPMAGCNSDNTDFVERGIFGCMCAGWQRDRTCPLSSVSRILRDKLTTTAVVMRCEATEVYDDREGARPVSLQIIGR